MKAKKVWFQAYFPDGAMGAPMKYRFEVKREFTHNGFTFLIGHPPKDEKYYSVYESSTGALISGDWLKIANAEAKALEVLGRYSQSQLEARVKYWLEKYGPVEKLPEWEPEGGSK
jgi:hypothetical protein